RAGSQQFLGHDIAFEHAALAAAIALGPGHADPAASAEPPAERRRAMTAEIAVRDPKASGELAGDELADLDPQSLAFRRQLDRVEMESGSHRRPTIRLATPTLQPVRSRSCPTPAFALCMMHQLINAWRTNQHGSPYRCPYRPHSVRADHGPRHQKRRALHC